MSKFVKDVSKISTRSKGKYHWKVITTTANDGKNREEHLIISGDPDAQQKLSDVFQSPGQYEIEYEKREDHWVAVGAKALGVTVQSPGEAKTESVAAPTLYGAHCLMTISQSALEASARVVSALVSSGSFKDAGVDSVQAFSLELFKNLAKEAKQFVQGE